ncbi:hypothetical protein COE85_29085, partial [Bacillus pseudomycoides]
MRIFLGKLRFLLVFVLLLVGCQSQGN